ncbi:hypothetical protein DE146DRAFT_449278 [Phaeosphaeria sp. MPI-PUGE-AT-0046c]|nr:hypothetical protein DE146DRAFT_449278 [Phaeosphaeria sp. MPI-PUGE-AT-0046c]
MIPSEWQELSANDVIDDSTLTSSLRGGYGTVEDVPKIMLAQYGMGVTASNGKMGEEDDDDDDDDVKSMLLQLERLKATHTRSSNDSPKHTALQLGEPVNDVSPTVAKGVSDDEDDDPAHMLIELARNSLLIRSTMLENTEEVNSEHLLAEIMSRMTVAHQTSGLDIDNEPTKTLRNFGARAKSTHDSESLKAPTSVEDLPLADHRSSADSQEEYIEALHNRLMGLQSTSPGPTPSILESQSVGMSDMSYVMKPDKNIVPYVVALQLEVAETPWEVALGWTKYLFGTSLDSHEARRKKDNILAQASQELDAVIEQVLREEEHHLGTEDKNRIPRRLIVSNLAAGASGDDLQEFFYPLRYKIQEIKVLPIRDPSKGTQVAHVDMFTRQDAVRASFTVGSIFGLIPILQLAERYDN